MIRGMDKEDMIYIYIHTHTSAQSLSCVQLFVTPWIVACQVSLSMEFSRQGYWSGVPFSTSGNCLNSGIKPASLASPALAGRFFTTNTTQQAQACCIYIYSKHIHVYAVYIFYTCVGYYSAIKKNKIMPYIAIPMDLEIFKLKEVNEKHI